MVGTLGLSNDSSCSGWPVTAVLPLIAAATEMLRYKPGQVWRRCDTQAQTRCWIAILSSIYRTKLYRTTLWSTRAHIVGVDGTDACCLGYEIRL